MALLAAVPLLVAHTGVAHGGGADRMRTLLFTVHDGEQEGETVSWFQLANRSDANPRIAVSPDERLVLHVHNAGDRDHNLRVAPPVGTATPVLEPGNESHVSMKVPQDAAGTIAYYDQVHREDGAEGTFHVAGSGSGEDGALTVGDPLVGALVVGGAVVALGWWSGRRRG